MVASVLRRPFSTTLKTEVLSIQDSGRGSLEDFPLGKVVLCLI